MSEGGGGGNCQGRGVAGVKKVQLLRRLYETFRQVEVQKFRF